MLEVIAYFVVPVFIILVIAYFTVEARRKREKEEKKQAIILRVATMKDNYKASVGRLADDKILTKRGQEAVYRIANNYFVFQSVSQESIGRCEELLEQIIKAMPVLNPDSCDLERAQGILSLFVRALPNTASGFGVAFYQQQLPELIVLLESFKTETNEEQLALHPMSSTAA